MLNKGRRKYLQILYTAIITAVLFFLSAAVFARTLSKDTLDVRLEKNVFIQGDTIAFEINLANYSKTERTATVQLWIEEIRSGRNWKYRYPLINGYVYVKLKVDSSMKDGVYAFNFLLQKTFFNFTGHVNNAGKKDKQLNYVIISKSKQTVMNTVTLDEQQSFTVRNLLFQDSAFIIFSRPGKKKNDLLIDAATQLDSSFVPGATCTKFITIGVADSLKQPVPEKTGYVFNPGNTKYKIILPEVIIKARSKARLEEFDRENATGLFSGPDAIVLDGIGSAEIANAPDLFTYLSIKAGGLRLETDTESGNRSFTWRGSTTDIYLNEIKLDPDVPFWINPSDIAMIKIFRPGTTLSADGSPGGAIAIYTKTGQYREDNNRRYSFYILGYTGVESTWK